MKKLLLLTFAASLLLGACNKDEKPTLSVSQHEFTIAAEGGEGQFAITSDGNWTVVADDPDMFSVFEPASGTGNSTFYFTVKGSPSLEKRTAVLTVSVAGGDPKMVTITQEPRLTLDAIIKLVPVSTVTDQGQPAGWFFYTDMVAYQLLLSTSKADIDALEALSAETEWVADFYLDPTLFPRYIDFTNPDLDAAYAPFKQVPAGATSSSGGVAYGANAQLNIAPGTYYFILVIMSENMGALFLSVDEDINIIRGSITIDIAETHVFTATNYWDGSVMHDELVITKE